MYNAVTVTILMARFCHLLVHRGNCFKMEDFGKSYFFYRDFVQSTSLVCLLWSSWWQHPGSRPAAHRAPAPQRLLWGSRWGWDPPPPGWWSRWCSWLDMGRRRSSGRCSRFVVAGRSPSATVWRCPDRGCAPWEWTRWPDRRCWKPWPGSRADLWTCTRPGCPAPSCPGTKRSPQCAPWLRTEGSVSPLSRWPPLTPLRGEGCWSTGAPGWGIPPLYMQTGASEREPAQWERRFSAPWRDLRSFSQHKWSSSPTPKIGKYFAMSLHRRVKVWAALKQSSPVRTLLNLSTCVNINLRWTKGDRLWSGNATSQS